MKKVRRYHIILLITLLLIFTNLFLVLKSGRQELPHNQWSKELLLKRISLSDDLTELDHQDIDIIFHKSHFYLFYYEDHSLYVSTYTQDLEEISNKRIKKDLYSVNDLDIQVLNSGNFKISFINNTQLLSLITTPDGQTVKEEILAYNVKSFKMLKDDVVYAKYNSIYLNDQKIVSMKEFSFMDAMYYDNHIIITYVDRDAKRYRYELNGLKVMATDQITKMNLSEFSLKSSTIVLNHGLTQDNNHIETTVVIHDKKKREFYNDTFIFDKNFTKISNSRKQTKGYNFQYLGTENNYMQNNLIPIGVQDLTTSKDVFPNLIKVSDTGQYPLTNTKRFPKKSKLRQNDQFTYLIFSENYRNKALDIYLSSNISEHITMSQKLNFRDYIDLAGNTIVTVLPLFIIGQLHSFLFLAPFLLFIVPFTYVKLTWSEHNQPFILSLSILSYLISKTIYLIFFIGTSSLPELIVPVLNRLLIGHIFSGISLFILWDMTKEQKNHFYKNFFIYFIVDMVIFTLFFSPYTVL